jgi:hypothetical protein
VQERALRFVYDDYTSSYINLLEKALVPSLQIRRIRTMALETYKIVIKLLKWLKLFSVLKWFGRSFHRVAAANMNDFLPYLVVLT